DQQYTDRNRCCGEDANHRCLRIQPLMRHDGANTHSRHISSHRRAVMAEAHDVVQLHLSKAEERGSITHLVAGKALGTQPRIAERDAKRRIVGTLRCALRTRRMLHFEECLETPPTLALQGLRPALKPFALG